MTAACSCSASLLEGSVIFMPPAAPLARPMTVSFVLVSPSTDICIHQASHFQQSTTLLKCSEQHMK